MDKISTYNKILLKRYVCNSWSVTFICMYIHTYNINISITNKPGGCTLKTITIVTDGRTDNRDFVENKFLNIFLRFFLSKCRKSHIRNNGNNNCGLSTLRQLKPRKTTGRACAKKSKTERARTSDKFGGNWISNVKFENLNVEKLCKMSFKNIKKIYFWILKIQLHLKSLQEKKKYKIINFRKKVCFILKFNQK